MNPASNRGIALAFFVGVFLLYLSFSPLSVTGMGYLGEEMKACRQLMGYDAVRSVDWPRNGAVGLAFQCPFLGLGRTVSEPSGAFDEMWLSLAPVLASSLLVTVLFVWCSRLAGSRAWGWALALAAGFGTMIWPYAYIGLETTQSLFLLLAGFLALEPRASRTWPRSILFGICAAIAVSAKSGGMLLVPAVGYLAWRFFRGSPGPETARSGAIGWKAAATLLLIVLVFAGNAYIRSLAWVQLGGTVSFAKGWLVHDLVSPALNLIALLGSPNKGLLVFAPVTILALVCLPRAFAVDRPVVIFALLTFLGLAGSLSFLEMWSDETWGPRYLHSALGPLVLCFAASRRSRPLRLRTEAPLAAAVLLGLGVSFLGTLFYYGSLGGVATTSTALTLPALQGDMTWNHVRFNARLLHAWWKGRRGGSAPEFLEPGRLWDFHTPPKILTWQAVDLRQLSNPQPALLRSLGPGATKLDRALPAYCALCLMGGLAILTWTGRAAWLKAGPGDG